MHAALSLSLWAHRVFGVGSQSHGRIEGLQDVSRCHLNGPFIRKQIAMRPGSPSTNLR